MFKKFCSCFQEQIEISFHLQILKTSKSQYYNDVLPIYPLQTQYESIIFLKDSYSHSLSIKLETNKGRIRPKNDYLYLIPIKAPIPTDFSKLSRVHRVKVNPENLNFESGFAQFSLENLTLNEPYIIHYLRKDDNSNNIQKFASSKQFKLNYRRYQAKFLLDTVFEDDPDFFKQIQEYPITLLNTPNHKNSKNHIRNYSNFTKSTASGESSFGKIRPNEKIIAHHQKNSLSLATPNNKKISLNIIPKSLNSKTQERNDDSNSLYSLRALNQIRTPLNKKKNNYGNNSQFISLFLTNSNKKENKESPDNSFFVNVNELSFAEVNKTKVSEKTKFIKNKNDILNDSELNFQTPSSKKRLCTVEEVHSFSNDSSSINETHKFKFINTNSEENKIRRKNTWKNIDFRIKDVVEEDDEISLNHITANEINFEENAKIHLKELLKSLENEIEIMPAFLIYNKENRNKFYKICNKFMKKFCELGFYFTINFDQMSINIYYNDNQIYQIYEFKLFSNLEEISNLLEDIFASARYSVL